MFNLKIKKLDGSKEESSYYDKWDAFTAAGWAYQDTEDDWGIGYLYAARKYITIANLAAKAFVFSSRGVEIIIEDDSNPAKEF